MGNAGVRKNLDIAVAIARRNVSWLAVADTKRRFARKAFAQHCCPTRRHSSTGCRRPRSCPQARLSARQQRIRIGSRDFEPSRRSFARQNGNADRSSSRPSPFGSEASSQQGPRRNVNHFTPPSHFKWYQAAGGLGTGWWAKSFKGVREDRGSCECAG